jgi:DNA-binding LytR/AlgR family response regulator
MNMSITAVIAEDEQLFRDALLDLLKSEWPELTIVATCDDGGAALDTIGETQPTVAFLDIRMPGLTGLDVAAAMQQVSPETQVVFVTAYDKYALDAFDQGAVDYLLKPVERERLVATIARLKKRIAERALGGTAGSPELAALIAKLTSRLPGASNEPPMSWITASVGKETRLIAVDDVIYFKSDNKYTAVVTAEMEALIRLPLYDLLKKLDGSKFKQVHRAAVVNLKEIAGVTRDESGRGTLRLKRRSETLAVSLTFMPLFKNM